jgi:glycosyltransferase involved in cell wall biosynthesis
MEFFNHCLSLDPDLLGDAKIIYDAEAVSAPREILRMEFLGEVMSAEDQAELIDKELQQSKLAEKIVAVSNNEADIFKRHGYSDTVVLGHTIASKPGSNGFIQRSGLLFVGALRDEGSPNVDSLLWFLINVFPMLEQALPGIQLNVVGDNSAPSLAAINKENINFTGRLDSIEEMYNASRVFIAPTRFAAGIPHKIHEAAAKGLPSVTTALLAQQLGWKDGKELLVADTPEAYAAQCIKLHQDEKLWRDVRDAGLTAITKDCSQETFRKNLAGLFV